MNTHSIDLIRYCAKSRGNSTIYLGTAGSHGNEQLQVTQGKGWEGLTVQVVFHPCKVAVQLPANGVLDVPWEATARPLTALQGRIVFQGFDQDRLVNSTDLAYSVASHSPTLGRDEQPYTPGIVECVLNQMAADKDAILQAAQQTGQAKEAAAASAAAAASSAANAQQSAGAANTSAGQAAASASQAAGSAASANETLTQVQTAGQEAQQKVKDAETEALGNISAAAPALPAVSAAAAWQSVTVKPDGTGYNLASMAPIEATIRPTVTGNPAVCKDSAAWASQGLAIYGKSTQDGEPSPENPVPIVSAGDGGSVFVYFTGKNIDKKQIVGAIYSVFSSVTAEVKTDGIHINGTSTGSYGILYRYDLDPHLIIKGSTLFVSSNIDDGIYLQVAVKNNDGSDRYIYGNKSYTITGEEKNLSIILQTSNVVKTFSDLVIYDYVSLTGKLDSWAPYCGTKYITLSTPNGLPGIPVTSGGNFTDADGQQLVCDVKDYAAGKYIQNCVSAVFDGSDDEAWYEQATTQPEKSRYCIRLGQAAQGTESAIPTNAICSAFKATSGVNTYNAVQGFSISADGTILHVYFDGITLLEFKSWLKSNQMIVVYPLASPIKTDIPAEELAAYRALQTYTGTTVVSTAEPVAGIEARYVMDGNKYRESVDKRLAALIELAGQVALLLADKEADQAPTSPAPETEAGGKA